MSAIVVKVDDTRMYQARCAHCWWRGKTYYTTRQAVEAAEAHNGAWHTCQHCPAGLTCPCCPDAYHPNGGAS